MTLAWAYLGFFVGLAAVVAWLMIWTNDGGE